MSKLANDVDEKMEERMDNIDLRAKAAGEKIDNLSPLLRKLQLDLENMDSMLSDRLLRGLKVYILQGNYLYIPS